MTLAAVSERRLSGGRRVALAGGFAAICFIWGSNYLAITVLVASLPPLLMAGLRSASGGAIPLVWAVALIISGERETRAGGPTP